MPGVLNNRFIVCRRQNKISVVRHCEWSSRPLDRLAPKRPVRDRSDRRAAIQNPLGSACYTEKRIEIVSEAGRRLITVLASTARYGFRRTKPPLDSQLFVIHTRPVSERHCRVGLPRVTNVPTLSLDYTQPPTTVSFCLYP